MSNGPGGTSVRFHGIPIRSNRLLFAQDVSGGMRNAVDKSKSDSPSKLKFANDELRRVLKSLGEDVHTNVWPVPFQAPASVPAPA